MKGIVGWFVGLVLIGGSTFGGLQAYKSASGELAYHKTLSEEKLHLHKRLLVSCC